METVMQTPERMRDFIAYHRRMLIFMAAACAAVAVVLVLASPGNLEWAGGFAVGAGAQLFKSGVIDLGVIKRIASEQKNAATAQVKGMYLFLLVLAAAAYLVFTLRLNPWAMLAGIVLPRAILVADTYIRPNPFGRTEPAADGRGVEDESA